MALTKNGLGFAPSVTDADGNQFLLYGTRETAEEARSIADAAALVVAGLSEGGRPMVADVWEVTEENRLRKGFDAQVTIHMVLVSGPAFELGNARHAEKGAH